MEKQICEMAELICDNMVHGLCDTTGYICNHNCEYKCRAKDLYNAGYRKQSGTAKEIFAEVGKILTAKYNSIQAGCHHRMRFGNADTPQGMKELGELSGVRQVIAEIKDFEKKYLEDNNDS